MWASGARSPRRAHAALRRHHRSDAAIQQIAQPLGHQRTNAGEAFASTFARISIIARTTSRGSGSPTPARVRPDHVALQLVEILAGNADIGQQPDAGVDGVNRVVAGRQRGRSERARPPSARRVRCEIGLPRQRARDGARRPAMREAVAIELQVACQWRFWRAAISSSMLTSSVG